MTLNNEDLAYCGQQAVQINHSQTNLFIFKIVTIQFVCAYMQVISWSACMYIMYHTCTLCIYVIYDSNYDQKTNWSPFCSGLYPEYHILIIINRFYLTNSCDTNYIFKNCHLHICRSMEILTQVFLFTRFDKKKISAIDTLRTLLVIIS